MAALPWKDGKAPLPVKDRPKCAYCREPLRPRVYRVYEKQTDDHGSRTVPIAREFLGYGDGFFCGQLHGYKWALHIFRQIVNGTITVKKIRA